MNSTYVVGSSCLSPSKELRSAEGDDECCNTECCSGVVKNVFNDNEGFEDKVTDIFLPLPIMGDLPDVVPSTSPSSSSKSGRRLFHKGDVNAYFNTIEPTANCTQESSLGLLGADMIDETCNLFADDSAERQMNDVVHHLGHAQDSSNCSLLNKLEQSCDRLPTCTLCSTPILNKTFRKIITDNVKLLPMSVSNDQLMNQSLLKKNALHLNLRTSDIVCGPETTVVNGGEMRVVFLLNAIRAASWLTDVTSCWSGITAIACSVMVHVAMLRMES